MGLGRRLGVDPTVVRVLFVATALASGFGLAAYLVGWVVLGVEEAAGTGLPEATAGGGVPGGSGGSGGSAGESIASRARSDVQGLALVVGMVPVLVILLLLASVTQVPWLGSIAWPLFVTAGGLVVVWRDGTDADRAPLRQLGAPIARLGAGPSGTWRRAVARAAVGVSLGLGGIGLLAAGNERALLGPLGGIALVLGGILVVFGPWWSNLARELAEERRARARAEERAEIASRVHDSVLQTLALLQRHAEDPQRVRALARGQERDLRAWLFEGRAPGGLPADVSTLAEALRQVQAEVEAAHATSVELVIVGDVPLDDRVEALVAAAREATVNAAKWSGAPSVSVYAEVEPSRLSTFVRDRGRGFERAAVGADRKGLSDSIEGRLRRVGGQALVRSQPGLGTEVELSLSLVALPQRGAR